MDRSANACNFRLGSFLAVAMLGGASTLAVMNPALIKPYPGEAILDGKWSLAYTRGFESANPIRNFAIQSLATANYLLFREGRSGVLVGNDGWLFSSEEMTQVTDPAKLIDKRVNYLIGAAHKLQRRGITVVIALIPSKLRVYPERGGRYQLLPQLTDTYARTRERLTQANIPAPDLLAPMERAKWHDPVFLHTDTHWTPFGAEVAAQAISKSLGDRPWNTIRYHWEWHGEAEHRGDLMNFLPLGPWQKLGPRPDNVSKADLVTDAGAGAQAEPQAQSLLSTEQPPVALIGTSYSHNPKWRFEQALERDLGTPILNVSREGRGPFKPMHDYLRDPQGTQTPPKVLIWEVPERYLWTSDPVVGLPQ